MALYVIPSSHEGSYRLNRFTEYFIYTALTLQFLVNHTKPNNISYSSCLTKITSFVNNVQGRALERDVNINVKMVR